MNYHYRARDQSGLPQEGRIKAESKVEALALLQQRNLIVTQLKPQRGLRLELGSEIRLRGPRKVTSRELALFCGQLASLLSAGVAVLSALTVLARQFKRTGLGPVLEGIIRSLQAGNSLSQAMREHDRVLPPSLIYITAVAEVSGSLDSSYLLLASQFEHEDHFGRKVKSAFTYPTVVLAVAFLVLFFMISVVLPTYGGLFGQMGAELPASTRFLIAFGQGVQRYWYLVPLLLLGVWAILRVLVRRPKVKIRLQRIALRVPILGPLIYKQELTRLCRTLGTMNRAGVPLLAALATAQEALDHQPLKEALAAVEEEVRRGETFASGLQRQPIFDRVSVEIIGLGEAAGNLDAMLYRVAELAERDVNTLLDRLTQILEPALTVMLGAIVVAIILPMLLPMFDILGKVQ